MTEDSATPRKSLRSSGIVAALAAFAMALTAFLESAMGRKIWGTGGKAGFWSGDINSSTNSQFLFDPYTSSHMLHGVLFYGFFWLIGRDWPLRVRLLLALVVECGWELLENSSFIIERYRAQTISLNYFGDSIMNSMCDILAATIGFLIAARLPVKVTIAIFIVVEVAMACTVRDNLTMNVIMLVYPVEVLKTWQGQL
ncbi:MAG: hypothetical protein JWO78_343 [Micavibrio sp.]|nr:hypothetical protein [Micavibrio sp.]